MMVLVHIVFDNPPWLVVENARFWKSTFSLLGLLENVRFGSFHTFDECLMENAPF